MAALLSDEKYQFAHLYGDVQCVIAGKLDAADLARTAKFGLLAAFANWGAFAEALLSRGGGLLDGRRLAMALWRAAVGEAAGVGFVQLEQAASQKLVRGRVHRQRATGAGES